MAYSGPSRVSPIRSGCSEIQSDSSGSNEGADYVPAQHVLGFLAGKLELEIGTQLPLWPRKSILILLSANTTTKEMSKKNRGKWEKKTVFVFHGRTTFFCTRTEFAYEKLSGIGNRQKHDVESYNKSKLIVTHGYDQHNHPLR